MNQNIGKVELISCTKDSRALFVMRRVGSSLHPSRVGHQVENRKRDGESRPALWLIGLIPTWGLIISIDAASDYYFLFRPLIHPKWKGRAPNQPSLRQSRLCGRFVFGVGFTPIYPPRLARPRLFRHPRKGKLSLLDTHFWNFSIFSGDGCQRR